MTKEIKDLITRIRTLANKEGLDNVQLTKLHSHPKFSNDELSMYFSTEEELAEILLEHERKEFEDIFSEQSFDENIDAIDILLTVSKEIALKYHNLTPSVTYIYKTKHPDIYSDHLQKRIDFIFMKIKINIDKGIQQNLYRSDFSVELVARRYISRLLDLHDPQNFPVKDFSFNTIFMQMFDNFVLSIATEKGTQHYQEKRKAIK